MVHTMSDSKKIFDEPKDGHKGEPEPSNHDDQEYVLLPNELHDGPRYFIGTNEDDVWRGTLGEDVAEGGGGSDSLWGDWGDDWLYGDSGDDYLSGGYGDDILIGGEGADILNGGKGFDIARYDSSDAGVTIDLATGEAHGGDAEGDSFYGIEGLIGSDHDDVLRGNAEDNYLYGNDGNDRLEGRGGGDTLVGGYGDNFLEGGEGDDQLHGNGDDDYLVGGLGADVLNGGDGEDAAIYVDSTSGVVIDLAAGTGTGGEAEGDTLVDIEKVIGYSHNDVQLGDDGDNLLFSLGGDDYLIGGDGDDVLMGGSGGDVLVVGAGTDLASYLDSSVGVSLDLAAGTADFGNATGDSLSGIENLEGSYSNDLLRGDAGFNEISGSKGDDVIYSSGGGDDMIAGGAGVDILAGHNGNDTASYAGSSASVIVNLDTSTGVGGDAQIDTLSGIENLIGSDHNDVLGGDAGDNNFTGGAGGDLIDAGDGTDRVIYANSSAGVAVDLGTGMGSGGHADGDILIGIENLFGSIHDDSLIVDANDNVLHGLDGADTIGGAAGSDVFSGGGDADTFIFGDGDGQDTITDFDAGTDVIDLQGYDLAGLGISDFASLASAMSAGPNVEISLLGGDSITLVGVTATDLDTGDFLF
jgi:Ca2+-binding RTX toxin-like protein